MPFKKAVQVVNPPARGWGFRAVGTAEAAGHGQQGHGVQQLVLGGGGVVYQAAGCMPQVGVRSTLRRLGIALSAAGFVEIKLSFTASRCSAVN
jgi:hypothetical protein